MKLRGFGDTTANIEAAVRGAVQALQGGGYTMQVGPGGVPYAPGGYNPGLAASQYPTQYPVPPGTVQGAATLPVIPMALGAAAGYYWKKSPLAGLVGAIGGYVLGNLFGSVAVQTQATPLMPSSQPYPGY